MQIVIASYPLKENVVFKQRPRKPIFTAEATKVETHCWHPGRLLEIGIHIRRKTPAFAYTRFPEQCEARNSLKLTEGRQVRIENIPVFSLWIRQEAPIAEKKRALSMAPEALPWE